MAGNSYTRLNLGKESLDMFWGLSGRFLRVAAFFLRRGLPHSQFLGYSYQVGSTEVGFAN
jgi:hypothetical protein